MTPMPRRPTVARAEVLTLADDLSVIARLENVLRAAASERHRQNPAMARFAAWLAGLR
jgi:hypothetical protein